MKSKHPEKFMAAPVPRFLRQSRLGYLPLDCIIGTFYTRGGGGSNLVYDVIMLPVPQFQRMKMNVGLQHVAVPTLNPGPSFQPGYVLTNTKYVIVPPGELDPKGYAKNHFLMQFGLLAPAEPDGWSSF